MQEIQMKAKKETRKKKEFHVRPYRPVLYFIKLKLLIF